MKKPILRVLAFILILLLIVPLVACANAGNNGGGKDKKDPGGKGEKETTRPLVEHGVPDRDFGDAQFNVLHWTVEESWIPWEEIAVANYVDTADVMTKDVYDRDSWLEENYGITVNQANYVHYIDLPQLIRQSMTGDDEWQMVVHCGYHLDGLFGSTDEYFLNLNDIENIDLTHPWWVKDSIDTLRMGEFVEFAASDLLLLDKGATSCVFFNKQLANNIGATDLYELAANKEWTIEVLADYATLGYEDDGNNVMDGSDQYGMSSGDDPVFMLYEGAGLRFINRDQNGNFYYQAGDEETVLALKTIFNEIMYADCFYNTYLNKNDPKPSFKNNNVVFTFGMIKSAIGYREMKEDYGILPVPMYNDKQKNYQSWVNTHHDSLLAVPSTVKDKAMVGTAIELLSYYSYYNLQDDFYDEVVCARNARDDESVEMLDIIFQNRVYDIGIIKDFDGFTDSQILRHTATGDTDFASVFGSAASKITEHVRKLNEIQALYSDR